MALPEMFSLAGRVAFVTGASGGLGAHCATVLHDAGAHVVLAARRVGLVAALAETLGARAAAVALDVADEASVNAALAAAAERFGPCDIIVNNAGISHPGPALEAPTADWDAVLGVNLRGSFLVAREAARRLIAAGLPGSIVNIASILGTRVAGGVAGYAASKAGLLQLTSALAVEWARHGIRVNALAPGYFVTDMNRDFFASAAGAAMLRRIPQRRLGQFADLSGPLLLLASAAGAHMTGSVVTVDGGHSVSPL